MSSKQILLPNVWCALMNLRQALKTGGRTILYVYNKHWVAGRALGQGHLGTRFILSSIHFLCEFCLLFQILPFCMKIKLERRYSLAPYFLGAWPSLLALCISHFCTFPFSWTFFSSVTVHCVMYAVLCRTILLSIEAWGVSGLVLGSFSVYSPSWWFWIYVDLR